MRILVYLHLHYIDQLDYYLDKLSNITEPGWKLAVSWARPDEEARRKILAFKPDTVFHETENVGYDIWPFIKVMSATDLSGFDYVIKLHTKGPASRRCRVNGVPLSGMRWRDRLVESLLGSSEVFGELDRIFATEPRTGLVCSAILYSSMDYKEDHTMLSDELRKLGLNTAERRYCAGTIFAFRPVILGPVLGHGLTADYFPSLCSSHAGGTMAHVYERILSILPIALGYEVHTVGSTVSFRIRTTYRRHVQTVLKQLFSLERRGEDQKKFLILFGLKFKIDDGPKQ